MTMKKGRLSDPRSRAGVVLYATTTVFLVAAFLCVFQLNANSSVFEGISYMEAIGHYADTDQYARLAYALLHGRFDLDLPVSSELATLDNPYSFQARFDVSGVDNPIFWDHAFYAGKYYCYFGVVPAVLVYAPYQLATGSMLPTPWAIAFIGVLAIIAVSLLVRRVGLRYFGDSSTTLSHIACLAAAFSGCNFAYLAFVARFYSVPIMSSMLFTALGLWFWMGAAGRRNESAPNAAAGVSVGRLAAGSACMALNLGCRPQFMLACFFAFVLFKDEIFATRELFSKRGIAATIAALAPFALIIAPLLAYNYARFGSVFDFGSNYNLTGFDMTQYRQSWRLTAILMLTYLFQPLAFSSEFPFITTTNTEHLQYGWAPNEPFFGGYFLLKSILIAALLFPFVWRTLKEKKLAGFVVLCALFTLVALFVDTRTAGITQRYFSDFGMYVSLASCVVLFAMQRRFGRGRTVGWKAVKVLVVLAIVATFVIGTLTLFSPQRYDAIIANNPQLYELLRSKFG